MKKIGYWLVFLLVLAAGMYFVLHRVPSPGKAGMRVVTSGYVPYTLVKQIAGDSVDVQMLLPPGAEPHSFEPTPGVLVALNQADAFVYVSNELEPWAADLARAAGEKTRVLVLADLFEKTDDPHVWMDFSNMKLMARETANLLGDLNPPKRSMYEQNARAFEMQLDELMQTFRRTLSACRYREVVHIGHLAFENLLRPQGIKLTALSGTSHEGEHSVKKLVQLARKIKAKNLPAIFTEESVSPRLAQTVAAETGVQILPLYSVEHISKKDFDAEVTYLELMKRNLESLERGLECPAS